MLPRQVLVGGLIKQPLNAGKLFIFLKFIKFVVQERLVFDVRFSTHSILPKTDFNKNADFQHGSSRSRVMHARKPHWSETVNKVTLKLLQGLFNTAKCRIRF